MNKISVGYEAKTDKTMDAAGLLRKIVSIASFSGGEHDRADFIVEHLESQGLAVERIGNNLLARVESSVSGAPTLMLNSHLDTVKPSAGYTSDPFDPPHDGSMICGLGSNDAGGALVAMVETTLHFNRHGGLGFNILLLLSAEEETSGAKGMPLAISHAGKVDAAIIGEPTNMRAAIAERGLLILDGVSHGIGGHAAHSEGENAIYKALHDIEILRSHRFTKVSPLMGKVKVSVTQISAGTQHNVVPDRCTFVVDVRPTDCYTNEEIWHELQGTVGSILTSRSLSNRSSATPPGHPLMQCAETLGIETYVSPTTSDWMRTGNIPAIKMGPGDSARSHTPDEYITVAELEGGIAGYIDFLKTLEI